MLPSDSPRFPECSIEPCVAQESWVRKTITHTYQACKKNENYWFLCCYSAWINFSVSEKGKLLPIATLCLEAYCREKYLDLARKQPIKMSAERSNVAPVLGRVELPAKSSWTVFSTRAKSIFRLKRDWQRHPVKSATLSKQVLPLQQRSPNETDHSLFAVSGNQSTNSWDSNEFPSLRLSRGR